MKVTHHITRFVRALGAVAAAFGVATAVVLLAAPVSAEAASRYEPVTAIVPVNFGVSGDTASEATTFTASIVAASGEEVAPEAATASRKGAGAVELAVPFDEVGEHHYTVSQVAGSAEGWTYDAQVYDVSIYCMWDESTDSLYTKTIVKDADGYKAEACTFTNTYTAPVVPTPEPEPTPSEPAKPAATTVATVVGKLTNTGDATSIAGIVACGVVGVVVVGAAVALRRRRAE